MEAQKIVFQFEPTIRIHQNISVYMTERSILYATFVYIYLYVICFGKLASATDFTLPRSLIWNQFEDIEAVITTHFKHFHTWYCNEDPLYSKNINK